MKLTKRHRANLRKHAKYLRSRYDKSQFDMRLFQRSNPVSNRLDNLSANICGAVLCVIGLAALTFPRVAKKHKDWLKFCEDIFGIDSYKNREEWQFLFESRWVFIDNTITGAADRIDYFLKHGVPDDCWNPEVYQTN